MATPRNHSQLAHAWAHQARPYGKAGNMMYEGLTLYSYGCHWPLAKLVTLADSGRIVVLLNPARRSRSTGQHLTHARRAVTHLDTVFLAPRTPIKSLSREFSNDWRGTEYWTEATLAEAVAAQREKDKADGEAERQERNRRAREARARKRDALIPWPEKLASWKRGERNQIAATSRPADCRWIEYLRLSADGKRVQTSGGAEILSRVAKAVWPAMRDAHAAGTALSLPAFQWGNYVGLSLEGGFLTVGCHKIPFSEVAEIAEELKI